MVQFSLCLFNEYSSFILSHTGNLDYKNAEERNISASLVLLLGSEGKGPKIKICFDGNYSTK